MKENQTTGIFVDLGYKEPTRIVVIKEDDVMDILTLHPKSDLEEVTSYVVRAAVKYGIYSRDIKCKFHPAAEHAFRDALVRATQLEYRG